MASFTLPVKLGQPICRHLPEEMLPYIEEGDWHALCDTLDVLALNALDNNATIFMRFSFMIALACLILVILFGYMDTQSDDEDDSGDVSTPLVLVTAAPISFPFIMAAILNCHGAATVSKMMKLCRSHCEQWAAAKGVDVRLEQLPPVSDEEVIIKIHFDFDAPKSMAGATIEAGVPQEASPLATP